MNEPNDQHRDELRDRLLDQALRETLGAESPPDLTDRILAAAEGQTSELPQVKGKQVMERPKRRRWEWVTGTTAACVVIGAVILLSVPPSQAPREIALEDTQYQMALGEYGGENQQQLQSIVDSSKSLDGAADANVVLWDVDNDGDGATHYLLVPADPSTMPPVNNPIASGQIPSGSAQQPLMEAIAGRPGYVTQQNQPRTVALSPDGKVVASVGGDLSQLRSFAFTGSTTATNRINVTGNVTSTGDVGLPDKYEVLLHQLQGDSDRITTNAPVRGQIQLQKDYLIEGKLPTQSLSETAAVHDSLSQLRTEVDQLRADVLKSLATRDAALSSLATNTDEANGLAIKREKLQQRAELAAEQLARAQEVLRKFTLESGQGPGLGGDQYVRLVENPFQAVKDHPLSTFSIDVDTASYANVRRFLLKDNQLPPPDAVRIEELVNYFDYDYSPPTSDVPFASHIAVAACPWAPEHRLVRIALKGHEIQTNQRPASNLVFLLDVSGSMNQPDKLPLLQAGMKLLAGQLSEDDRVAIVVYAGSEGLVLPSTVGDQRATILGAIDRLKAGGSTNGGAGIELAYKIAREQFIEDGVNRVILCTDGDFNVGTTSTGALERMVEEKAKSGVFLSVLGFGRGNLNDAMMETISNKGNGNYAYIDGITEAQKVLVEQMGGTLVTIAKDVKIQVEFNPAQAEAYRLIGYENRMLAAEDFNDDKKDAGEIGAGHTVTALYEVVPAGGEVDLPDVDPLKYQGEPKKTRNKEAVGELLTLKLRYKQPDGDTSELLEFPLTDSDASFTKADPDFQFAAAVASFGMLLRGSQHRGLSSYNAVLEIAESAKGEDEHGYRAEFVDMVKRAKPMGEERAALLEEAEKLLEAAEKAATKQPE